MSLRSLMIRGFPRSMTSLTYNVLQEALSHQLHVPDPSKRRNHLPINGEILARSTIIPRIENGAIDAETFELAWPALKLHEGGYLVKDVLQPWIVNHYLEKRAGSYVTLFIQRPLADILFRLKAFGWLSPKRAACPINKVEGCKLACSNCTLWSIPPDEALARGIVTTNRRFFQPLSRHAAVLDWDRMVLDPDYLFEEVEKLGYTPKRTNWMDSLFENKRKAVLAYRLDNEWKRGRDLLDAIESGK